MIGYIYKITNPNGKIYIGQTIHIKKRLNVYKSCNCKGQIKIYRSLLKYGFDNHLFEILEECDYLLLNEREIFWISYYDSYNNGLNLTIGGEGKSGCIPSEETRKKMSESSKASVNKGRFKKGNIPHNKGVSKIDDKKKYHNDYNKIYYEKNKEILLHNRKEYNKKWRKNNMSKCYEYTKAYRKRQKDKKKCIRK